MSIETTMSRSFGVHRHPRCPQCGKLMSLTMRGLSAELGALYERQIFSCECEYEVPRIADAEGRLAAQRPRRLFLGSVCLYAGHDEVTGRGRVRGHAAIGGEATRAATSKSNVL
jgi:hypothetical protein